MGDKKNVSFSWRNIKMQSPKLHLSRIVFRSKFQFTGLFVKMSCWKYTHRNCVIPRTYDQHEQWMESTWSWYSQLKLDKVFSALEFEMRQMPVVTPIEYQIIKY